MTIEITPTGPGADDWQIVRGGGGLFGGITQLGTRDTKQDAISFARSKAKAGEEIRIKNQNGRERVIQKGTDNTTKTKNTKKRRFGKAASAARRLGKGADRVAEDAGKGELDIIESSGGSDDLDILGESDSKSGSLDMDLDDLD